MEKSVVCTGPYGLCNASIREGNRTKHGVWRNGVAPWGAFSMCSKEIFPSQDHATTLGPENKEGAPSPSLHPGHPLCSCIRYIKAPPPYRNRQCQSTIRNVGLAQQPPGDPMITVGIHCMHRADLGQKKRSIVSLVYMLAAHTR